MHKQRNAFKSLPLVEYLISCKCVSVAVDGGELYSLEKVIKYSFFSRYMSPSIGPKIALRRNRCSENRVNSVTDQFKFPQNIPNLLVSH